MNKNVKKAVVKRLRTKSTRLTTNALCKLGRNGHHAYCVMGLVARTLGVKPKDLAGKTDLSTIEGDYGDLYEKAGINGTIEGRLIEINDDDTERGHVNRKALLKALRKY